MSDQLAFERIWQDDNCFQVRVYAESSCISAFGDFYMTDDHILELSKELSEFPQSHTHQVFWECSKRGKHWTPYISLRFFLKNRRGNARVEVFMEIDDEGPLDTHCCCFYLDVELEALRSFGPRLQRIMCRNIGDKVSLITLER